MGAPDLTMPYRTRDDRTMRKLAGTLEGRMNGPVAIRARKAQAGTNMARLPPRARRLRPRLLLREGLLITRGRASLRLRRRSRRWRSSIQQPPRGIMIHPPSFLARVGGGARSRIGPPLRV